MKMTKNCIISVALMLLAICPSASALRASDDIVKKDVVITTQNKNIYDRDGSHGVTVRNVSVINGGGLKLVGNVEIYPSFLVEGGSSLEIKSH